MKSMSILLALLIATSAMAADPADEVRRTEIAFAKAFADRDQAAFFKFVADDATFFPSLRTLNGKQQVTERWSRFFTAKEAPFSWGPERVAVNTAGNIGLSTGPVFDTNGKHIGNFTSTWVKQSDGSWKILFDGPGESVACLPGVVEPAEEGFITTEDGVKLHYRKIGSGPIRLIMPLGFIVYDDFKMLGDLTTLITYDMRNRGRSDAVKDLSTVTIQQDVKDLETVRKHFNIDQFVPIGYSYLGLMVALYAVDHPQHVSRLIQLSPVQMKASTKFEKHGYEDMPVPDADLQLWQSMRAQKTSEQKPREFCEAEAKVLQYVLVGNGAHASRVTTHCDLENEWPAHLDKAIAVSQASIEKVNLTADDLKKISMPVLTIHGTKDRNAPYGGGREWAMLLPNARLVTIEGAGHQTWADDPVNVFGSIREFLRGNWPLGAEKVTN